MTWSSSVNSTPTSTHSPVPHSPLRFPSHGTPTSITVSLAASTTLQNLFCSEIHINWFLCLKSHSPPPLQIYFQFFLWLTTPCPCNMYTGSQTAKNGCGIKTNIFSASLTVPSYPALHYRIWLCTDRYLGKWTSKWSCLLAEKFIKLPRSLLVHFISY